MSTIYAPVKDGQIVETGSQNSLKKANAGPVFTHTKQD